jgi:hypothetical protein
VRFARRGAGVHTHNSLPYPTKADADLLDQARKKAAEALTASGEGSGDLPAWPWFSERFISSRGKADLHRDRVRWDEFWYELEDLINT